MLINIVINTGITGGVLYFCTLIAKAIVVYMIYKTPKLSNSKVENIIKLFTR